MVVVLPGLEYCWQTKSTVQRKESGGSMYIGQFFPVHINI